MTRIVRTSYRYKRPPKRKKPVTIEVPAVITTAIKRRRTSDEAKAALAASVTLAPGELERQPTPAATEPGEPAPRAAQQARPSAIVTVRRKAARIIPPDLRPETPEEHQRRGEAADTLWRELVRRVRGRT
jgi:hypothetical protein